MKCTWIVVSSVVSLVPLCGCSGSHAPADASGVDAIRADHEFGETSTVDTVVNDTATDHDGDALDASAPPTDATAPAPAWLRGHAVKEWFAIPGTEGAGGAVANAYSGMTVREDTSEVWVAAAGGHSDSSDNRVVSLDLRLDAPAWVMRHAPSPESARVADVPYYTDGLPASRHVYSSIHWIASVHRVMLVGLYFTWPNAHTFQTVDGFDPDANAWDPAGRWADVPLGQSSVRDGDDRVWTSGFAAFTPRTNQWSQPITTSSIPMRFPVAYDAHRRQLFSFMWGDGWGDGTGINASRIPVDGNAQLPVELAPSAALTAWQALAPANAAMDYDPVEDHFLFYDGRTDPGEVFVITPQDSGAWTMSTLTLGAGSGSVPRTVDAGINSRFRYVPALQGLVMMPDASQPLYFLRLR